MVSSIGVQAEPAVTSPPLLNTIEGINIDEDALLNPRDNIHFGDSVAISGDTAIVGSPTFSSAGLRSEGAAWVFMRSGGSWALQARLVASDAAAGDEFGYSVAISGDTAIIGAPFSGFPGSPAKAYVFVRSGGSWAQQGAALTAGNDATAGDLFGFSVAISGDTAVVGAPFHHVSADLPKTGAAYVFVRSGGSWAPEDTLEAFDAAAGDQFGYSVAISNDMLSPHIVVGAPFRDDVGAAYTFVRRAFDLPPGGGDWIPQDRLTASDAAAGDQFGFSVAISGDTAIVGALFHDSDAGAAYAFTVGKYGDWTQQAEFASSAGTGDRRFGASVAISGDTAIVGARFGAAYVFVRSGGSWALQGDRIVGAVDEGFGYSVAISGDTAIVGAPELDAPGRSSTGAAYVFVRSGGSWALQAPLAGGYYFIPPDPIVAAGRSYVVSIVNDVIEWTTKDGGQQTR